MHGSVIDGFFLENTKAKGLTGPQWKSAYALCEQELLRLGLEPTHYWVSKEDGADKQRRVGTSAHRNRLERGFDDLDGVGFTVTPPNGTNPYGEWYAQVGFSCWAGSDYGLEAEFMFDAEKCPIGSSAFDETLKTVLAFSDWDYGWAISRERARSPHLYLSGQASGRGFTDEDDRRTDLWYAAYEPDERVGRLRDVFEYNIVNIRQLGHPVGSSDLRSFILANPHSRLESLTENLRLWRVRSEMCESVRQQLLGTGLIVTE